MFYRLISSVYIAKARPDSTQGGIGTCHSYIVVRRSALSVSFSPNLLGGVFFLMVFCIRFYFLFSISLAKIYYFPSTAIISMGIF